jgi:hypothetical protein
LILKGKRQKAKGKRPETQKARGQREERKEKSVQNKGQQERPRCPPGFSLNRLLASAFASAFLLFSLALFFGLLSSAFLGLLPFTC